MIKNIVWDVDRTLVNSYHGEMKSLRDAMTIALERDYPQEVYDQLTVLPTQKFFELLKLTDEEIEKVNQEWDVQYKINPPRCFEGIKDIVKSLKNDYHMSVVTSRTIEEYHELDYELEELKDYFDDIVTSDKVKDPKPAPDSMEYLYKNQNYQMDETVYIGDSQIDYLFTKNAKCHFIQATWDRERVAGAKYAAKKPEEILDVLKEIK